MEQTSRELGVDFLILSKFPRSHLDSLTWVSSADEKAAVTLTPTARMAATDAAEAPDSRSCSSRASLSSVATGGRVAPSVNLRSPVGP